ERRFKGERFKIWVEINRAVRECLSGVACKMRLFRASNGSDPAKLWRRHHRRSSSCACSIEIGIGANRWEVNRTNMSYRSYTTSGLLPTTHRRLNPPGSFDEAFVPKFKH